MAPAAAILGALRCVLADLRLLLLPLRGGDKGMKAWTQATTNASTTTRVSRRRCCCVPGVKGIICGWARGFGRARQDRREHDRIASRVRGFQSVVFEVGLVQTRVRVGLWGDVVGLGVRRGAQTNKRHKPHTSGAQAYVKVGGRRIDSPSANKNTHTREPACACLGRSQRATTANARRAHVNAFCSFSFSVFLFFFPSFGCWF